MPLLVFIFISRHKRDFFLKNNNNEFQKKTILPLSSVSFFLVFYLGIYFFFCLPSLFCVGPVLKKKKIPPKIFCLYFALPSLSLLKMKRKEREAIENETVCFS